MGAYDACRLLALNFYSFVRNPFTQEAYIDYDELYAIAYEQQRLADDLIDLEIEHIDRIIDKIKSDPEPIDAKRTELELWQNIRRITEWSRRTGCGFTALGDMLAAMNLKYDSEEAMNIIGQVMDTKMKAELDCTIDLAVIRGPFTGWSHDLEYKTISHKTNEVPKWKGTNDFYDNLLDNFPNQCERMRQWGRRNVSWSTVAPTGSVSILTQTTSGLEPLFAPYYMRRKKVNPGENVRVDFVDQNGDAWMEYPILHPKFKEWLLLYPDLWLNPSIAAPERDGDGWIYSVSKDNIEYAFKQSPWYGSTANDIDWKNRVEIQSIIQQYTTHSISSTINLPNEVTVEDVNTIYLHSHDTNLKGVTVYRDGSRSGVLFTEPTKSKDEFVQHDAPKRPDTLPCDIKRTKVKGDIFTVIVGLYDGKPYEIFAIPSSIMEGYTSGILTKKARGVYNLTCSLDDEIAIIKDITQSMNDEQEALTRLISTSLRHGAEIRFIVEQLSKTDGELHSFTKAIARTLKAYIPDGADSTLACLECGSKALVFEEGCQVCKECGSSKCG
jgi:ribonucleoside-diphosphate reductase alpha chain